MASVERDDGRQRRHLHADRLLHRQPGHSRLLRGYQTLHIVQKEKRQRRRRRCANNLKY